MNIVQLSDFHFGNDKSVFNYNTLSESLSKWLEKNCEDPVLIISGDITFKGYKSGYKQAIFFLEHLINNKVVDRKKIIMCPGNHDIDEDKSFTNFDIFSNEIRKDNLCTFSEHSCRELLIDGVLFRLFNSSYNLNHKYGLINLEEVPIINTEHTGLKIAVTHHHLLNIFEDDTSAIRNGYSFLNHLEEEGFSYILHGHQHAPMNYYLGKNTIKVHSVRSGNYNQKGYLNSINIYRLDEEKNSALIFEQGQNCINFKEMEL